MVVLAASITTTSGKPLLSRQFKDLSKDRVLELLSNFQNLVSNISSDHTFVEDRHVRYVYKPFDEFYIILITNRQSNIIQDLTTLNLFSQTITTHVNNYDEYEIYENAFGILSSFDEIICMGYKENLSATQVSNFLSMESHEEKIQDIIERNKEMEATEERKRRAKEIARREQDRKNGIVGPDGMTPEIAKFSGSNDPNVKNAFNSYYTHASATASQAYAKESEHLYTVPSRYGNGTSYNTNRKKEVEAMGHSKVAGSSSNFKPGGSKASFFSNEEESKPTNNGILLSVNETINASFNRDGSIESSELKGVFEIRVNDSSYADSVIKLSDSVDVKDRSLQFKTHPNINKAQFLNEKTIALKDSSKSFPHNDQSLGVLRWRKVGKADDTSLVPLELATWVTPNSTGSSFDVTIEFEVNQDFQDIKIENLGFFVPIPTSSIKINEDNNDFDASVVDINDEVGIVLKIGSPLESGQTGSVSFTIESEAEEALFPIDTSFIVKDTSISGVNIEYIANREDTADVYPYDLIMSLSSDEYNIV
ncbi:similar to Saccharomyces cerevisiae YFR051C RET2 Delta subunit of the coatomer complex (COPI), which coats Golgi-derived transport vesicles [Maudiozyma barnettii]|uniref:Coatomer subunit delta n=1 Tax=Maudiozyma barnettii TaxID=61262 RepID=A0A8H2VIF9_9SACH|nr:coatomer subunit delta [Kazachstania barnettii]CAB4256234.1 similar to Saccharomyces cerevisiae YFR051C RET2 Delta subunit of the coatomer complex (COPI), which coats Golgi-derived transport vesicles [Kazachstania barnettii]CAD1784843.1 similar to Saccharomyces cerevisiae YFR051C RET2 Delta subunit of the coatomer complex (COPI), which coats Golgi-derived transport vesicles [Kazachstania barnettii]